jgi:hypothetical protein
MLGKEVAVLINEFIYEGRHEVIFDASELSSGLYAYVLSSGDFLQSKKMLLVK